MFVLWVLASPLAWAERHALLIAVNRVEALPERLRLRGPANDVGLMHRTLLELGVPAAHITVLAQRSPLAAAAPTHAEVQRAMQRIGRTVGAGDTVVLHLAGHGVQVPQALPLRAGAASEPDGLDEVFLLQDSGPWDAATGQLPRALRDDDIGAWIDALVDRGARVFAVFDSCHAAGMAREPSPYARWRSVAAAELGVPTHPAAGRPAPGQVLAYHPARTDGRVLAYAARGHELAAEEWLPKGGSLASARVHGVFSWEMAGALSAGARNATDLATALRTRYRTAQRVRPTPLITGDGPLFAN
ncbi:MAG: caspase family protein [Burkholderiales bacterium]|nr:caspase family protein [Burkholderiales bacterium]